MVAAWLANFFLETNDRRRVAFDLFSEFNAPEMHFVRVRANSLLAENIKLESSLVDEEEKRNHPTYFGDFTELDNKDIQNKRTIYQILNFYKKIELLRKANRIDRALICILFGEIFYYWWKYCFDRYTINNNWQAFELVRDLKNWMAKNTTTNQKLTWEKTNQAARSFSTKESKEEVKISHSDLESNIQSLVAKELSKRKRRAR